MFEKLEELQQRYAELTSMMSDPAIASDPTQYRAIAKEHGQLEELVRASERHHDVLVEIDEAKELIDEAADEEFAALAREELSALETERDELVQSIKMMLIPRDPLDDKNIYLEIRAGTGGDEAAIFAGDMLRMYTRYASARGWRMTITDSSDGDHGGYKEVVALIEGDDVYSRLKYESGTHRVQRVPATESQGRIHTSAVTLSLIHISEPTRPY